MTIAATVGAIATYAGVSSAASCPSSVASFALRKNYVTLKQLQELRLKEQLEEEEKLRDRDFNVRGAEAARSSSDRPPSGLRRSGVPWPAAPLSISELSGGQGTDDVSAPALAIGECAGGDGKRTWKRKDTAKSDVGKRAGPEDSSENPIPVKKQGNGRNRRARAQHKLAAVSGGEPEVEVLESEQASWDNPIPAKERKRQNRRARRQPKLPVISGGGSEVAAIESEAASSKNHIPAMKEGERRNQHRARAQRKLARVSGGRPEVAATESEGASSKNPIPMKKVGENQNRRRAPTQSKLAGVSRSGPEPSTIESKEAPSKKQNPIPTKQVAEDQNRRRLTAQPNLAGVSSDQPEVATTKSDEPSSKNPIRMKKEREVRNRRLTQPKITWAPCDRPEPSVQMQQQGFNGGEEAVAGTPRKASKPAREPGPAGFVWVRKTPSS